MSRVLSCQCEIDTVDSSSTRAAAVHGAYHWQQCSWNRGSRGLAGARVALARALVTIRAGTRRASHPGENADLQRGTPVA